MFGVRAAADVEEVGRFAAVELDQIHRAHGEAGTVHQAADVAFELDVAKARFAGPQFVRVFFREIAEFGKLLLDAFVGTDAAQIEINPLAVTDKGELLVLDAKVGFDSNAEFRHPDLEALRDVTEEDPMEVEASKHDLAYIKLDGNIGCMVNGAGLAMATMDIIKLEGGEPANFLDVGGGANKEKVTAAFKIILADPAVKGILVNIFGGIMPCDRIARGIVSAVKTVGLKVPLVVRLEGTNVNEGKAVIDQSGLNLTSASDLEDGARKAAMAVKGK